MDCDNKVQILMAVYNGAAYLSDQLDSLISQSYQNWELLISDDNSTDESIDIIRDFSNKDSRIRVVLDGVNAGSAKKNFMNLIGAADADYVMFCDQDDVWDSDKIDITLDRMKREESKSQSLPILVSTDLRVVDKNLNIISDSFLKMSGMKATKTDFGYFMSSCLVTGCTMMINRSLCRLIQDNQPNVDSILMHDWWLSLVASAFGRVAYIDSRTINYRQHGDNSVGAKKRSILHAFFTLDDMHEHMMDTLKQVAEFKRLYDGMVAEDVRKQMNSYLVLSDSNRLGNIISLLNEANAWRDDWLGNIGMVIAFLWRK